jgi:hypothetical protein
LLFGIVLLARNLLHSLKTSTTIIIGVFLQLSNFVHQPRTLCIALKTVCSFSV